jgi:hypothetical protein
MDTLAALCWLVDMCNCGAGATSHVEALARLVAQHQNPAQRRTVLAVLRHIHLPYSVASDSELPAGDEPWPWDGWSPGRADRDPSSAREGEKVRNMLRVNKVSVHKVLETLFSTQF